MKFVGLIAAAAVGLSMVGEASAMPITPSIDSPSRMIQVRGGCGYGEHRGPFGGCRLNRGPRGFIRRLQTGAPRGCPPRRTRIRGICRFVR